MSSFSLTFQYNTRICVYFYSIAPTYEKAKVKAEKIGISFNEVLNQLLENWIVED